MSLKNVSNDAREIVEPNNFDKIIIERPISSESPPSEEDIEVNLKGYSSNFGGQLVDRNYKIVEKSVNENGNLEIAVSTSDGEQGGDYVVEYSVEDDTGTVDNAQFFYQNGVYPVSDAGNSTFRISSELERFSGTFVNNQTVQEATNFANVGGDFVEMPDLDYLTTGSSFRKHSGEPIPYFEGNGIVTFPSNMFSSRASTALIALQWEQNFDKSFIVAQIRQGNKNYVEIRNEQNVIEVQSDFANGSIYEAFQYAGNIIVVSCVIDPENSQVSGSINREITKPPQTLTGEAFSSGLPRINLDPEGELGQVKLFDVITYDEVISEENLNRISKQLSYFYGADMISPGLEETGSFPRKDKIGSGSPKIQNHIFFNEDILKYDVLLAGNPVESYDVSVDPAIREWNFPATGSAVAFNAHRKAVVANQESNDVSLVTSDGEEIWSFGGHSNIVNAVESGKQYRVYTASEDGTVRKIGKEGNEIWNYDNIPDGESFRSLALYDELALYVGTSDGTVRRIVESDGSEDWTVDLIEDSTNPLVDVIEVNRSEQIFAGCANGEIRSFNKDGNELFNTIPFEEEFTESGTFQEDPITDLAVIEDNLYVTSASQSESYIAKIDAVNGNIYWKIGPVQIQNTKAELQSVGVHPNGSVFVYGKEFNGSDGRLFKIKDGEIVAEPVEISGDVRDISIQPGTPEPHWKS
jgi:hypothetical protein